MVGKLRALLIIALCFPLVGAWPNTGRKYPATVAAYVGPGDIVASPEWWFGLRAFNNTQANSGVSTTAMLDVLGSNTVTACTIYLKGDGTGGLDLSTAGAGGVGHQCLLGATTFCTVTNTSCTISKMYDQSGHLRHVTQSTAANQPTFTFSCTGGLPCATFNGTTDQLTTNGAGAPVLPVTLSAVAENTAAAQVSLYYDSNALQVGFHAGAANNAFFFEGTSTVTQTAADNADHSAIIVFRGDATTSISIDNNTVTGNGGSGATTAQILLGSVGASQFLSGFIQEIGFWATGFSGANITNMCHNQFTYWSSSTSC